MCFSAGVISIKSRVAASADRNGTERAHLLLHLALEQGLADEVVVFLGLEGREVLEILRRTLLRALELAHGAHHELVLHFPTAQTGLELSERESI